MTSRRKMLADIAAGIEASHDPYRQMGDINDALVPLGPSQPMNLMDPLGGGGGGGGMSRQTLSKIMSAISSSAGGTKGLAAPEPLSGGRISQRYPKPGKEGWKGKENPLEENLLINMDVARSQPDKLQQMADLMLAYPNTTKAMRETTDPNERLLMLQEQARDNLLFMHDLMPKDAAARAQLWYPGAHEITGTSAEKYGIPHEASAGNAAVLSPSKDWFQNVYQHDKTLEWLDRDPKITADMIAKAASMPVYQKDPATIPLMKGLIGRRLSNLSVEEQALAIRAMDELANPSQVYPRVSPEGVRGDPVMNKDGSTRSNVWQSFENIGKSIQAATSGADMELISKLMGGAHKVRGFYNNIIAPDEGAKFGDVTGDTHHVAASLFRPIGGSNVEVGHALDTAKTGQPGAPVSATTGMKGFYPLYADAAREAAALRDLPARAMQSITWEAGRSLFDNKSAKMQRLVDAIWQAHGAGEKTAQQAREEIVKTMGGFTPPSW